MTYKTTILLITVTLALFAVGCDDKDNFLEGSLGDQYDLSFGSVEATQYLNSRQLLIEYIRGNEKPIQVIFTPTPEGPGTFTYEDGEVSIDNSLLPGSADLPRLTSATVELLEFSPEAADTNCEGNVGAMFTNEGLGTSFSLDGGFKAPLEIAPF